MNKTFENGQAQFKLTQPHLIQGFINFVKLSDSWLHDTPAKPGNLSARDGEGRHRVYDWSYHSLLGMLNYLCGALSDILYAVHHCSRFCNDPRLSHEKATKYIIRYLKQTPKEGLMLRPDSS
jgi:hypothetical protein